MILNCTNPTINHTSSSYLRMRVSVYPCVIPVFLHKSRSQSQQSRAHAWLVSRRVACALVFTCSPYSVDAFTLSFFLFLSLFLSFSSLRSYGAQWKIRPLQNGDTGYHQEKTEWTRGENKQKRFSLLRRHPSQWPCWFTKQWTCTG